MAHKTRKILTPKEWVSIVKQLGMMHIVYWKVKETEDFMAEARKKIGSSQPIIPIMYRFVELFPTEKILMDELDRWEQQYKKSFEQKNVS